MKTCLEVLERLSKGYIDTDDLDTIRLILKALEIIKKKRVNIISLLSSIEWYNPSHYNDSVGCPIGGELTQEEYDLLKGVLNET